MSQIRTLDRINPEDYTPARLEGDVDYSVYDQLSVFDHRGHCCDINRVFSYLGAAIDNMAVLEGETSAPVTFSEFDAVDIVMDSLEKKFPAWFGRDEALENLETTVSEQHLRKSDLRNQYWADQVAPDTQPVEGDDWDAQKRVIIPLFAIVLDEIRTQMKVDGVLETEDAQSEIKRTIIQEAVEHNLSQAEINAAVREAHGILAKR